MDKYSWGQNRPPKGLPIEGEISVQSADKRIPTDLKLPSGTQQAKKATNAFGCFLICRAYKEPQPLSLVEDLLLQRNFIID